MNFDIFEYTDKGGRSYNEDAVGHKVNGENGIFVVADGLGGHLLGELASACVRDTLTKEWQGDVGEDPEAWFTEKIALANQELLQIQKEKNTVMKSTAVVLTIQGDTAAWANVGDSRLYYLHRSEICSYTNDHSVSYKKYKGGEITRDQIRTDEDQPCLLRAIGNTDHSNPETYGKGITLEAGDAFLLCSDGVWEYLQDEEILIDLLKAKNAQEWAEFMLLRLMQRVQGGNDNLSLITVMIG